MNTTDPTFIDQCLDQLTALLIAAGKCQPDQVPHKVSQAKAELAELRKPKTAWSSGSYVEWKNASGGTERFPIRGWMMHSGGGMQVDITNALKNRDEEIKGLQESLARLNKIISDWNQSYCSTYDRVRDAGFKLMVNDTADSILNRIGKVYAEMAHRKPGTCIHCGEVHKRDVSHWEHCQKHPANDIILELKQQREALQAETQRLNGKHDTLRTNLFKVLNAD